MKDPKTMSNKALVDCLLLVDKFAVKETNLDKYNEWLYELYELRTEILRRLNKED